MSEARMAPAAPRDERFEDLLGRFFDGPLPEADDRDFAGMLAGDPAKAGRFLEQVRMEALLAGLASPARASEPAFVAAVKRGVELAEDKIDTKNFADEVVKRVKSGRRKQPSAGRFVTSPSPRVLGLPPRVLAAAFAALLFLGALAAWRYTHTQTPSNERIVRTPPKERAPVVARIGALDGLGAAFQPNEDRAAAAEAKAGDEVRANDRLVTNRLAPGEASADARGVPLILPDGSTMLLGPGTSFSFSTEKDRVFPLLEAGLADVRAQPQPPGRPLTVRTQAGPSATVVGTAFTLEAEPAGRVRLAVREGQVRFGNTGAEELVAAGFASAAEPHGPPLAPQALAARTASISGRALNPRTGKPEPNMTVRACPIARRRSETRKELYVEAPCDAEGRFHLPAIPAVPTILMVRAPEGGRAIRSMGGMKRVDPKPGEDMKIDLDIYKVSLMLGHLLDEKNKSVPEVEVLALPEGSDGLLIPYTFNFTYPASEFRSAVFFGAGAYEIAARKKGMVVDIGPDQRVKMPEDAFVSLIITSKLRPSAAVQGRVLGEDGRPFVDPPGTDVMAPEAVRTILTLILPSGKKQMLIPEADGSFVFDTDLVAGLYQLRAERPGCERVSVSFDLKDGERLAKDVTLRAFRR
ncbi:MAG: FecR domain-containing protein [Planctomycetota bacterium]|nr:FecR domain-containing protein [Planctomycetota bacterium]